MWVVHKMSVGHSHGRNMRASILITAHNYEQFVEECILSCLGQKGFDPYEVIVIDDGSTDRTAEIARSYEPDVKVITTENQGVERASNLGLSQATGEFVVRVDADDRLKADYLAIMVSGIEKSGVAFVYSEYTQIDAEGHPMKEVSLPDFDVAEIQERGDFLATGTLYRKEAIVGVGGYDERVKNCGLENYGLVLNLLARRYAAKCVHLPLFDYRIHESNMSLIRRQSIITYGSVLAARFDLPGYRTNENHPYGLIL